MVAKRWNRSETWVTLLVIGAGMIPLFVGGLWMFMSATSQPIHPTAAAVPAQASAEPEPAWVDAVTRAREIARTAVAGHNLPALSVAVGTGDRLVWAEAFGYADLERRLAVTPDTPFHIGSASTLFTSAAAGLLLERERLKLDEDIQAYVKDFPEKQWPVTLKQLMGHTAGIVPDEGDEEPVGLRCTDKAEALRRFADRPLMFEPGTEYRYSSFGWVLMSAAVESAAGEPFADAMRALVFTPLGLQHTRVDAASPPGPAPAAYYFPRFAADPRYGPQEPETVDYSCFSGAAGIVTTPSDLVRFVMAVNAGRLLQPGTVTLLQTSQQLASGPDAGKDTGYGLGWDLETIEVGGESTRVLATDGDMRGGMVATVIAVPGTGLVVAAVSNTSYAGTDAIARDVAQAFARGQSRAPGPGPRP